MKDAPWIEDTPEIKDYEGKFIPKDEEYLCLYGGFLCAPV